MVIQAWPKFFKSKDSTSETVDLVTPLNKRTVLSSRRNLRKFIFDIIGIMFKFKEFFIEIGVTTKESENTLTLVMMVKRTPSGTRLVSTDSESWTAITSLLEAKLRPPLRMKKSPKNMITNTMMNPYPNPHLSTHLILPINNPNFWPETWPDILPASLQKWRPLPQPQGQDYPQPRLLWEFFHEDKFNWKDFPPDLTLLSNQTKLDNILSYLFLWTKYSVNITSASIYWVYRFYAKYASDHTMTENIEWFWSLVFSAFFSGHLKLFGWHPENIGKISH